MQLCLACARQESDMGKTECRCGGALWVPTHVAGLFGCRDLDLAARLIRSGLKPWDKVASVDFSASGRMSQKY